MQGIGIGELGVAALLMISLCPVKLSGSAAEPRIAPRQGQHTDEALKGLLNAGGELAELREGRLIK